MHWFFLFIYILTHFDTCSHIFSITHSLTAFSGDLFGKLIVAQLVEKYPVIYGPEGLLRVYKGNI
jgi:hypothetical protein